MFGFASAPNSHAECRALAYSAHVTESRVWNNKLICITNGIAGTVIVSLFYIFFLLPIELYDYLTAISSLPVSDCGSPHVTVLDID